MYWSVRRELWENRSIYIAPLAVAAVVLFGFLDQLIDLPGIWEQPLSARPDAISTKRSRSRTTWRRL